MTDNRRQGWMALECLTMWPSSALKQSLKSIRCAVLIWVLIANWSPESNLSDNSPHIQKSISSIPIRPTMCINLSAGTKRCQSTKTQSHCFHLQLVSYILRVLLCVTSQVVVVLSGAYEVVWRRDSTVYISLHYVLSYGKKTNWITNSCLVRSHYIVVFNLTCVPLYNL